MYYTYMLRCEDNSIYTGITTDVKRRLEEHSSKGKKSAKYTKWHTAKKIEACFSANTRKTASQLEYRIKELKKEEKEALISNNNLIVKFFDGKIEELEDIKSVNYNEI